MADNSAIEWTEATWNPVTGCDKVSPGCAHCYAETFAERWRGIPGHPYEQRDLALHIGSSTEFNREQLNTLVTIFRFGALLLVVEVLAWVLALAAVR